MFQSHANAAFLAQQCYLTKLLTLPKLSTSLLAKRVQWYPSLFVLLTSQHFGSSDKAVSNEYSKRNTVLVGETATRDSIIDWFRECQNLGWKQDGHYRLTAYSAHQLKAYKKNI